MARHYTKTNRLSTGDMEVNGHPGGAIPAIGEAEFHVGDIEIVDGPKMRTKAEEAAFMEELVTVFIEEDDEPNAPIFVHSGHQGVTQYIQRGKLQTIKRKFLYSLASAKHTSFACSYGMKEGGEFNLLTPKARGTHRLYVERDDNPIGRRWLMDVMRNGG